MSASEPFGPRPNTTNLPAGAPGCAEPPCWRCQGNWPLPEPLGGLSYQGVVVWIMVEVTPGATQRQLLRHLAPAFGRQFVKDGIAAGLQQGWLDVRQDGPRGAHRHYLRGSRLVPAEIVETALTLLEYALCNGYRLPPSDRRRLRAVLDRVVLSTALPENGQ